MTLSFEDLIPPLPRRNPYIAWGEALSERLDKREFHGPRREAADDLRQVLVRCKDENTSAQDAFDIIEQLTDASVSSAEQRLVGDVFRQSGTALEFLALVPAQWTLNIADGDPEQEAFLRLFEPIAQGQRIFDAQERADVIAEADRDRAKSDTPASVVAGIIDDGIAYLNRRFFDGATPRLKALMIQTPAFFRRAAQTADVLTYQTVSEADIVARRAEADRFGERATYMRAHRADPLLSAGIPAGIRKTVEHAASHGSHLLDLVAGAPPVVGATPDPREALLRSIPVLAAQLPPQSVDDTSGARLEIPILQAMRWMILQAFDLGADHLVINLSFGVSAGSKDGNGLLEQAFETLVDQAAQSGLAVHLVLPFGNEYSARGVQRASLLPKTDPHYVESAAEIVLGRADETPSFVEIRTKGQAHLPSDLEVSIAGPGCPATPFRCLEPGTATHILSDGAVVARLTHVSAQDPLGGGAAAAMLHLAFAPTAPPRRGPPAPREDTPFGLAAPGRWRVAFRRPADTGLETEMIVQVQRDESAFGYHFRGTQTVLDDPHAYGWSQLFRDRSDLEPSSKLSGSGTNTAYVSRARRSGPKGGIYAIASARDYYRRADGAQRPAPSYYSSERADWSAAQPPDQAVVLASEPANAGILGTGTLSGSARRLTGSSVAAALFSRAMILKLSGVTTEATPSSGYENRLGASISVPPEEIRKYNRRRQARRADPEVSP